VFVVGFIGFPAMNFFPAEVESIEDGTARIAGDSVAHSVSPPACSSLAQPSLSACVPNIERLAPRAISPLPGLWNSSSGWGKPHTPMFGAPTTR
jgi:hypothetical protein